MKATYWKQYNQRISRLITKSKQSARNMVKVLLSIVTTTTVAALVNVVTTAS